MQSDFDLKYDFEKLYNTLTASHTCNFLRMLTDGTFFTKLFIGLGQNLCYLAAFSTRGLSHTRQNKIKGTRLGPDRNESALPFFSPKLHALVPSLKRCLINTGGAHHKSP
jgi:hypothetical protein